jgi:signal transduction histidine kinase
MNLASTVDNERRRISEELHDRVGPNLASIGLNLKIIAGKLTTRADPELLQLLSESQALLTQTIVEIRELSGELRPARLEYAGLEPALADFVQQFRRRTGVETRLTVALALPGDPQQRLGTDLEWLLYRVIQEALTNCARHATAGSVVVDLRRKDDLIHLQISDDGVGFDPDAIGRSSEPPGLGLLEMRERILAAQGRFTVSARPGHGTHILATVPVAQLVVQPAVADDA